MTPLKERPQNLSLASDSDDMEDASVLSSPPRSCQSKSRLSGCSTPHSQQNRRLFDDTGSSDDELIIPTHTPFRSRQVTTVTRPTLRPFDLNHDLQLESVISMDNMDSSTSGNREQHGDVGGAGAAAAGRKRSSAERRGGGTSEHHYHHTPNHCNLDLSSDSMDQGMFTSPHISPNSFLTMDGRFVQSKNPFSSPMMTDDDATPAYLPAVPAYSSSSTSSAAPPLPVSFSSGDVRLPSILPPRHQRSLQKRETAERSPMGLLNGGFPDKRYSFTGSPIAEDHMETDTATCGSLHKVRRLNKSADVVAATGHHLSARRKELAIQTNAYASLLTEEEISPTEVFSFPPPTPTKTRPSQQHQYQSVRRQELTTPSMSRGKYIPTRTPHPGSMVHHTNGDDDDGGTHDRPKSRFYGDFDIIGELGKGGFGNVYKVLSRLDGCMYAIKAAKRKAKGIADRDRMLKEVYALAALSDQADTATFHIVRYHQAWMEDDRLYIQTELCTGTLADEVRRHGGGLPEPRRFKILREILLALDFIHRNCMVHLDIKPENIFLKNDQYKLGDFGLVTKITAHQEVEEGDSRYMSMELLSGGCDDLTKSDIFSLGATLYEICLRMPLPMNGQEWQDIRAGFLQLLLDTSNDLANLIHHMMEPNPSSRPAAAMLLKHHQLLSDEQKALFAEKCKVAQATWQLAAQKFGMPPRKKMQRANTWNGSSMQGSDE